MNKRHKLLQLLLKVFLTFMLSGFTAAGQTWDQAQKLWVDLV
jgi:hypothetical protein